MRDYKPEDHDQIMSWWAKRGKAPIPPEYFSDSGFIVDGVAAIFLYRTNSAIAYLECLISNPDADKAQRNQALDDLIDHGCDVARDAGYKLILATTSDESVLTRVKSHGFMAEPNHNQLAKLL